MKVIEKKNGRVRVFTRNKAPSMASQEFKAECDVNNIMSGYLKTGNWPGQQRPGMYGDFSQFDDFASAVELVQESSHLFSELPASVRKRFGNDPHELIEFIQDPKNMDEAIKLGIVPKPPAPKKEPAVTPPVETPDSSPKKDVKSK